MRDQPSWTAQSVATEIMMIAEDPQFRYLVPEDVKEATMIIFKTLPGLRGLFAAFTMHRAFHKVLGLVEKFISPNKALYLALRKRWIEDQVRDSISKEISQVVIIGAGFDTLAYRLHREYPEVKWFEVDHPATQAVKNNALVKNGHVGPNMQFVACDLTLDPDLKALQAHNLFDRRERTLFIAEGLFAYLEPQIVGKILKTFHKCGEIGSQLLGTMNARKGTFNPLIDMKLRLIGEPYRWGLPTTELPGLLRDCAWDIMEVKSGQSLADRYLRQIKTIDIPEDEYLFSAVKDFGPA